MLVAVDVVATFFATSTTRDAAAWSVALGVAIVCLSILSVRDIRVSHPVLMRAATCLLVVDVLVLATYFFPSFTNYNLAIGAAMAIVLLGLSFLTGASGQISLGNAAFMGVGALAVAIWANHHPTTPIAVVLFIAVVCGAVVGLLLAGHQAK